MYVFIKGQEMGTICLFDYVIFRALILITSKCSSDNVACATGVTEGERGGGISGRARGLLQLVYFSFYLFCNV